MAAALKLTGESPGGQEMTLLCAAVSRVDLHLVDGDIYSAQRCDAIDQEKSAGFVSDPGNIV